MRYGRELVGHPFNAKALCTRGIIVVQRLVFSRWLGRFNLHAPLDYDVEGRQACETIRELLLRDAPCMIARYGAGELEATLRRLDISLPGPAALKFLKLLVGKSGPFWWDNSIRAGVSWNAGLFPPTDEMLNRFGEQMLNDSRQIDLLASWQAAGEKRMHSLFFPAGQAIPFLDLEPFFFEDPWTTALKGKKVLLVHPFEATIRSQYARRGLLFKNPDILPEFTLKTVKAVQSIAGSSTGFSTWFDALDHMCRQISAIDFDIAIIGAGAYGFPLAAHVKRIGKKAIHMGGATQLLFGIKGKRYDDRTQYAEGLYNDFWVRPAPEDYPANFKTIELGCYW